MLKYEHYQNIIQKSEIITNWLLLALADKVENKKDIYLRNSIARCHTLLNSISALYYIKSYNDGWILYRSMLDRLIYLIHLEKTNSYEVFDAWTYVKAYKYNNTARADEKFKRVLRDPYFNISKEDTAKYYSLKKEAEKFKKPDPRRTLKAKGFDFLYKYGYDYSSRQTHPMFDDGVLEFHDITGLEPNPYENFNQENLIKDSIIVHKICQQEILNNLSFSFNKIIYEYLDSIMSALELKTEEFETAVYKLVKSIEDEVELIRTVYP